MSFGLYIHIPFCEQHCHYCAFPVSVSGVKSHGPYVGRLLRELDAGQLKLQAGQSLDFETEPSLNVTVTSTDTGGLSTNQVFALAVNNVNEAPTAISLDNTSFY